MGPEKQGESPHFSWAFCFMSRCLNFTFKDLLKVCKRPSQFYLRKACSVDVGQTDRGNSGAEQSIGTPQLCILIASSFLQSSLLEHRDLNLVECSKTGGQSRLGHWLWDQVCDRLWISEDWNVGLLTKLACGGGCGESGYGVRWQRWSFVNFSSCMRCSKAHFLMFESPHPYMYFFVISVSQL